MTEDVLMRTIESLRRAPALLAEATRSLAPTAITRKPSEKGFSILENVAHLHDIDGERLAVERRYNDRDLDEEVRGFSEARLETVRALEGVSASMLERTGEFEKVGPVTLGRLLGMLVEHDRGHLRDIEELRSSEGCP